MKLLDPFAGYRLASGHAFFHIALFSCSWIVSSLDVPDNDSTQIKHCFVVLRWGHFILVALAFIENFLVKPSEIPGLDRTDLEDTS